MQSNTPVTPFVVLEHTGDTVIENTKCYAGDIGDTIVMLEQITVLLKKKWDSIVMLGETEKDRWHRYKK